MTPLQLRALLEKLPEKVPMTDAFEAKKDSQSSHPHSTWYRSQKEHWLGWLGEYSGPGAYARKNANRDAQFIYNHFQCSPGLLWLAEASGVSPKLLILGRDAMQRAGERPASQCAAFRKVVPWKVVDEAIKQRLNNKQQKTDTRFGHALFKFLRFSKK